MNYSRYYILSIGVLTAYTPLYSMDWEYLDSQDAQRVLQGSGDLLWYEQKFCLDASPKPSPNKYFALHDLIQSPDTPLTDTKELETKVRNLLILYPKHRTITNKVGQTACDLLKLELTKQNLTDQARLNFETIRRILEEAARE